MFSFQKGNLNKMGNKAREIEWVNVQNGESVGKFPLKRTISGDYICPQCGKPAEYAEGEFDQDRMGNAICGWWFTCWPCGIGTEATEGGFGAFRG